MHCQDDTSWGKYYLLRNVLQKLNDDLPGSRFGKFFDETEGQPDSGWVDEQIKRAPPAGFSAVRGKREMSDSSYDSVKRFPSSQDFFGARGKKDSIPGKRLPSNKDFFGARGKKSQMRRYPSHLDVYGMPFIKTMGVNKRQGESNERNREGIKRIPQSHMFFGARGKKSDTDIDQDKRVLANHFFGVRGKKSMELKTILRNDVSHAKRLLPNHISGARWGKSDFEMKKELSENDLLGAEGKVSDLDDYEMNKRFSANDFFGARGRRNAEESEDDVLA